MTRALRSLQTDEERVQYLLANTHLWSSKPSLPSAAVAPRVVPDNTGVDFKELDRYQGNASTLHQYKRLTRFREVLRYIQGVKQGHIPTEVINDVRSFHKKHRIVPSDITPDSVKRALKWYKHTKFNEHSVRLAVELNTTYLRPRFPKDLVRTLESMFMQCNNIWEKTVCKDLELYAMRQRVNFPHYATVLYRLLQILDREEEQELVRPYLLKSLALRREQDIFWWFFCNALGWPYFTISSNLDLNLRGKKRFSFAVDLPQAAPLRVCKKPNDKEFALPPPMRVRDMVDEALYNINGQSLRERMRLASTDPLPVCPSTTGPLLRLLRDCPLQSTNLLSLPSSRRVCRILS